MNVKIKHNHWFPKLLKVNGITIGSKILLRDEPKNVKRNTYKHELQHCYQIEAVGFFKFYLSYFMYYLAGYIYLGNWEQSYYDIPYEREAYEVEDSPFTNKDVDILKKEGISYE